MNDIVQYDVCEACGCAEIERNKSHREIWRDLFDYQGKYEVSNLGRVRNSKTKKLLKPDPDKNGYLRVKLVHPHERTSNGDLKITQHMVHRLVALEFIPIRSMTLDQINHIDERKWNNAVYNLEWSNNSLNQLARYKLARERILYGDNNPHRKLSYEQIKEIKVKYSTGFYTQKELAEEYGVTQTSIAALLADKYVKIRKSSKENFLKNKEKNNEVDIQKEGSNKDT